MKTIIFSLLFFTIPFLMAQPNIVKNGNLRDLIYDCEAGLQNIDSICATPLFWEEISINRIETWDNNSNLRKYKQIALYDTAFIIQSSINMPDAALVLLGVCNKSNAFPFSREYIVGNLFYPLQFGHQYKVSFYFYSTDYYCEGLKEMGIKLDEEKPNLNDLRPIITNKNVINFSIPESSNEWHKMESIITAKGGEQFITIGVFSAEKNIKINNCNTNKNKGSYTTCQLLPIADISIIALDSTEWILAESKKTEIVGVNTDKQQKIKMQKFSFTFANSSSNISANNIDEFYQQLNAKNIPFNITISSPKGFSNISKPLAEQRAKTLQDWLNTFGATKILFDIPIKILLQQSNEINLIFEYKDFEK